MKVFLSELAEYKLRNTAEYIESKWGKSARNNFLNKFTKKISQISILPQSCPESVEFKGLFMCVVSKQTTFFYRVNNIRNEIEIITVFDTRQAPEKLDDEVTNS